MARKTFCDILSELTPQSTGNHPVIVSMPFLYYHLGRYHVVSLVTGGQSVGEFVHANRDAGRLLGLAFYHPENHTGEYLTPQRAAEKYGLDLTRLTGRASAKLGQKDADDKIVLPAKLDPQIAEKFIKGRASLEDYNSHVMLAAAQNVAEGKRILAFRLNPDSVPRVPNSPRRKLFWLSFAIVALLFGYVLLSHGISNSSDAISNLKKQVEELKTQNAELKSELSDQRTAQASLDSGYNYADAISADENNGNVADHIRGNTESKVVLISYVDYQCPGCATVWPTLEQLHTEFRNQVKFINRNYPLSFHQNARIAARAAESAAKQNLYWEMSKALFEQQGTWASLGQTECRRVFRDIFTKLSDQADAAKFLADLESDSVYAKVSFDYNIGSQIHDVSYTPTIYVAGQKVDFSGENPNVYELVSGAIKRALKK